VCKFFDDESQKKKIFHCDKCGICRVGGKENTFHCDPCGSCMPNHLMNNHECKKDRFQDDCAVCMEKLFNSRDAP
jgi:RING finger/CHY zinc finger protein 1